MSSIWGQFESPVTLSAKMESIARAGEVANVVVTAKMDSEWKIYALRDQGEGPIATRVTVLGDIIKDSGLKKEVFNKCYIFANKFREDLKDFDNKRSYKSELSDRLEL